MRHITSNQSTIGIEYKLVEFNYDNKLIKIAVHLNDYIGMVINGERSPYPHIKTFYEIAILEYIKSKFSGGVALDIGANIGNHSIFFSKFIFNKVFAFEANNKNYELLLENKKINDLTDEKLTIFSVALSDGEYLFKNLEVSNNMGGNRVIEGDGNQLTKKLNDFNLPKIDFIKMDVEGHELRILKGGNNLIDRDHPEIILECNENTDSDFRFVNPYMLSLNYKLIKDFGQLKHYSYK